ncbi:MAG TPA: hypothetical protein VFA60_12910 [Terriglobales bacterium]|nr:hypothetical protein [Terriglobales bacterium]
MKTKFAFFLLATIWAGSALGQVSIENPDGLPVSREEMTLAYKVGRQAVFDELFRGARQVAELPITLQLGCEDAERHDEYYTVSESKRGNTIEQQAMVCMRAWDVEKFTYAVIRLTERRLIAPDRYLPLLTSGLQRIRQMAPVSVGELKGRSDGPRPVR